MYLPGIPAVDPAAGARVAPIGGIFSGTITSLAGTAGSDSPGREAEGAWPEGGGSEFDTGLRLPDSPVLSPPG